MHVAGGYSVNGQGAATYQVPLVLSPGTSGVTPELSLAYASTSGPGLVGQGWLLSGIPTIERCAATVARDGGVQGAVRFDKNDRFCLAGSRLMVVNGKEYGADGAEYRTELDSFSKIISYGISGDGPNSFKVWTKAGRLLEFGNSTSSHIEAQGRSTVRVWALNRNSDAKGNYYDVFYVKNANTGEYYPDRIDYTGNSVTGAAPYNLVKFNYATLPTIDVAYRNGSVIQSTVRIASIKAYAGQDLVSEYRLGYREDVPWEASRLVSLQRCDANGGCLPAMNFGWTLRPTVQLQPGAWQSTGSAAVSQVFGAKLVQLDINGDGKTDLVQPSNRDYILWLTPMISNGAGFDVGPAINTGLPFAPVLAGDVNGDGKSDLIYSSPAYASAQVEYRSNATYIPLISNGSTFTIGATTSNPPNNNLNCETLEPMAMDIDGDGRTDIVQACNANGDLWLQTLISNGSTFVAQSNSLLVSRHLEYNARMSLKQGDFDGDGKQDLIELWQDWPTARVYAMPLLSNGKNFTAGRWLDTGLYLNDYQTPFDYVYAVDVNGDATQDLLFAKKVEGTGAIDLTPIYSDGISLIRGATSSVNPAGDVKNVLPADINGDGKMDLLFELWSATDTYMSARLVLEPVISTGATFKSLNSYDTGQLYFTTKFWTQDEEGNYIRRELGPGLVFLDFNGDGQTDMIQLKDEQDEVTPLSVLPYQSIGGRGSLMQSVDNGLGANTTWTYKPLTDNAVYTKDSNADAASYPMADLQTPLFVVDQVRAPNGNGGVLTSTYKYGGLKVDMNRRAWTGFRWTESTQNDTGIVQRVVYRQDWPFWGAPSVQQTRLAGRGNNGLLQEISTSYHCTDFVSATGCTSAPGRRYFVAPNHVTSQSWDLNGVGFPATVMDMEYDAWGNANMRKMTRDAYVTTVRTWFSNDLDKWFIGRPLRVEESRTIP